MKVWIVMKGERYEGGYVEAVYADEAAAQAHFKASVEKLLDVPKAVWEDRGPEYIKERTDILESWACIACDTIEYFSKEVL